jgi:hypothetical protein
MDIPGRAAIFFPQTAFRRATQRTDGPVRFVFSGLDQYPHAHDLLPSGLPLIIARIATAAHVETGNGSTRKT